MFWRALRGSFQWAAGQRRFGAALGATHLGRAAVRRFVAGFTLDEALPELQRLQYAGFRTTVDVLGEASRSEAAITHAVAQYVDTLQALADRGLDRNVSLKPSHFGLSLGEARCAQALAAVAAKAKETDAFVRLDMEDHTATDATLKLASELQSPHEKIGVVIQAYLRRSRGDLQTLIDRGVRVRLCKGAYSEPSAVAFQSRAEIDANYLFLAKVLLDSGNYPAFATHDPALIHAIKQEAAARRASPGRFEFQMLYGVRRDLQTELAASGFTVRVYVPYGTEWYPYFMRRLGERPANIAFLARSVLAEATARGR